MNIMRKRLTLVGALIVVFFLTVFMLVFISLSLTKSSVGTDEFKPVDTATFDRNVDITKPIIDISGWQLPSEMDYDQLANQVNGVIVRVQHGISMKKTNNAAYKNGLDKAMSTHIKEFQKRNVPVAVYAYVNGKSEEEMRKEADAFYDRAAEFNPTYWWLDVEEVTMKKDFNAGVEAFRQQLAKRGAKNIGIYTQDWFVTANNIDVSHYSSVWLAHYGRDTGFWDTSPDTTIGYDLHQYTSRGKLNGFAGDLDFNRVTNVSDYNKIFNHGHLMK